MQIRYEIDKKAIGRNLKRERDRLGCTQEKLAEAIGVTSKYLSKIENGASAPSLPYILKFAEVTGSDLNNLLLGRYPSDGGRKELIRESPDHLGDPAPNLSGRNRRLYSELIKCIAEVLEKTS